MQWADSLFDLVMYPLETLSLNRIRRERVGQVAGSVLELGAGTGVNLSHYDFSKINELVLSDLAVSDRAMERSSGVPVRSSFRIADVQDLPFEDEAFDHVVFTLVFCSVENPHQGLSEVRRVLKPGGRVTFIEHVRPATGSLGSAVDILNPAWNYLTRECNINRDTLGAIKAAGFTVLDLRHSGRGLLIDGVATK